jgi:hypothetical protein
MVFLFWRAERQIRGMFNTPGSACHKWSRYNHYSTRVSILLNTATQHRDAFVQYWHEFEIFRCGRYRALVIRNHWRKTFTLPPYRAIGSLLSVASATQTIALVIRSHSRTTISTSSLPCNQQPPKCCFSDPNNGSCNSQPPTNNHFHFLIPWNQRPKQWLL